MDVNASRIERLLSERAWLRRLAGALARDAGTADDLAQQTWLAALERAPGEVRSPRAWLGTVVRNLARDRARSEGRRTRRETGREPPAPIPPPDELAARAELTERVGRLVLELEEPYREAVLLRFYEDLPPRRIAAHLGIPVETVRTRVKRALAKLGRRLDVEHGGDRRAWAVPLLLWAKAPDPAAVSAVVGGMAVKKTLAFLVLALVGLFVAVRWGPTLVGDRPNRDAQRAGLEREEPEPSPEAPTLRGAADAAESTPPPPAADVLDWALVGTVVYPGRVPAAGARVRLFAGGDAPAPDDVGTTDARGRFLLRPRGPLESRLHMFRITAEDGQGNVASREKWNVEVPRDDDAAAGRLVLRPGHPLLVRVESAGAPVPGAAVDVFNAGYQRHSHLASTATDEDGLARVEGLLPLLYRLEASAKGWPREVVLVSLPQAAGVPFRISLDSPRTLEVEVVEAPEMRPLAGVEVRVYRSLVWSNTSQQYPLPPSIEIPLTDAGGRTRVEGLGRSPHLGLGLLARGYATPYYDRAKQAWEGRTSKTVPIPPDEDTLRVVVPAPRRVTWPLVEGDAPVPADGTVVRLDAGRTGMRPWGVDEGVVESGRLVVDGLSEGYFTARGRTPAGLVARIVAAPKEAEGAPLAFWRPRTLEVVLTDAEGAPLEKVSVRLDAADGPQVTTPFAFTDADGVARWTGLPALRGRVRPNATPHDTHAVDLSEGGQRIAVRAETPEAERTHPVSILVRLVGQPGLPDEYDLDSAEYDASIALEGEEEAQALLRARWAPAKERDEGRFVLRARGYQPASFSVATGTELVEVNLEKACVLRVAVLHEAGRRPRCHLQRLDEDRAWQRHAGTSVTRHGVNMKPLNPPAQGFERTYDGLAPGRYRVHDAKAKRASDVVVLHVGEPTPVLEFDCRPAAQTSGRVVLPAGHAAEDAIVQVHVGAQTREVRVDADGRFAFPWPAEADSVGLVARHALLGAHATRGRVVLRGPREDLHLELVEGPIAEVEIRVASAEPQRFVPTRAVRVHLWSSEDAGAAATVLPAHLVGEEGGVWRLTFAGYEPGTWSLWSDIGHGYAPLRLHDVQLGELDPTVGPVTLTRGSSIRIRVETPDGKPPPLLVASAEFDGLPFHRRYGADTETAELVLTGLEAGRYRVTAGPVDPMVDEPPTAVDEVIEVDGRTTYERLIHAR